MILNIKAKNLDLTPSIKEYIEKKIGSISHFIQRWEEEGAVEADFELSRTTRHHHKGKVFYAEINLNIGGKFLRAEYSGEDIHEVVDKVKDEIKREVVKFKEKATK